MLYLNLNSECIPLLNAAARYYRQCYTGFSELFAVSVWARCLRPVKRNQGCGAISLVTTRLKILQCVPTVETARTLHPCCVFCYCMEYSAAWDVLNVQVMYKLLTSYETAWFSVMFRLPRVTATCITSVNTMVLEIRINYQLGAIEYLFVYFS